MMSTDSLTVDRFHQRDRLVALAVACAPGSEGSAA